MRKFEFLIGFVVLYVLSLLIIMAYNDIGFNDDLVREELIPTSQVELDPFQFESFAPDLSGSKIQGGMIQSTKGGTVLDLEGNRLIFSEGSLKRIVQGLLDDGTTGISILSDDEDDIVRINSSGITVNDGKIIVKDETNETILDSKGLISTANFNFNQSSSSTTFSTSSTTFIDVGFSINITLPRTANVLIGINIPGARANITVGGAEGGVFFRLLLDSAQIGPTLMNTSNSTTSSSQAMLASTFIQKISAGSHVIRPQWKVRANNNGFIDPIGEDNISISIFYVVLGT